MLRPLPAGLAPSTSILAFAAGLFLLIASVRMMLVALFAPETPYYDEWDGVIELMARPLLAGRFDASTLLQLHNEHLLLWTRLLSYAQLRLADLQFDNVSVCLASQCLYAAMAAWLIAAATRHLGAYAPAFALAAGLVAVLPYGWENIAMGWGNPYYFLVGFSAGTVVLAARLRTAAGSVPLALCALAAGVSMGSGAAAGVVALLAIALRHRPHAACIVPERREERTTEGGLDAAGQHNVLSQCLPRSRRSSPSRCPRRPQRRSGGRASPANSRC